MSDLREQIAKRLAALVKSVDGIAGLSDYENACELARADEVIRLMRWSRHAYRWANPETRQWDWPPDPTEDVSTLPPPEWKP